MCHLHFLFLKNQIKEFTEAHHCPFPFHSSSQAGGTTGYNGLDADHIPVHNQDMATVHSKFLHFSPIHKRQFWWGFPLFTKILFQDLSYPSNLYFSYDNPSSYDKLSYPWEIYLSAPLGLALQFTAQSSTGINYEVNNAQTLTVMFLF